MSSGSPPKNIMFKYSHIILFSVDIRLDTPRLKKIRYYLQLTKKDGIARRYFIMNGFDGAMTVFGVVLGAWLAGVTNPGIIILACFGACLAMGFSGFFGAFMAEHAEKERHLKELEEHNRAEQFDHEASKLAIFYIALIDGLSPALTAAAGVTPFILARLFLIPIQWAYVISTIANMLTLFALGLYLGKTAKENGWFYGLIMLTVGLFTVAVICLVQLFLGV